MVAFPRARIDAAHEQAMAAVPARATAPGPTRSRRRRREGRHTRIRGRPWCGRSPLALLRLRRDDLEAEVRADPVQEVVAPTGAIGAAAGDLPRDPEGEERGGERGYLLRGRRDDALPGQRDLARLVQGSVLADEVDEHRCARRVGGQRLADPLEDRSAVAPRRALDHSELAHDTRLRLLLLLLLLVGRLLRGLGLALRERRRRVLLGALLAGTRARRLRRLLVVRRLDADAARLEQEHTPALAPCHVGDELVRVAVTDLRMPRSRYGADVPAVDDRASDGRRVPQRLREADDLFPVVARARAPDDRRLGMLLPDRFKFGLRLLDGPRSTGVVVAVETGDLLLQCLDRRWLIERELGDERGITELHRDARVGRGDVARGKCVLDRLRCLQQAQRVRDGGLVPAHRLRELALGLLRQIEPRPVALGLFQGGEVLALQVLHERGRRGLGIGEVADDDRDLDELRALRGRQAPAAGDDGVAAVLPDGDERLEDALRADGGLELAELADVLADVALVDAQVADRDGLDGRGLEDRHDDTSSCCRRFSL